MPVDMKSKIKEETNPDHQNSCPFLNDPLLVIIGKRGI